MFFIERNVFCLFPPGDIIVIDPEHTSNRGSESERVSDLPHYRASIEFTTVLFWFILKREATHRIQI